MFSAALFLVLAPRAHADEVVLRNDTAYDDTFGTSDHVAWLGYPECAGIVLDPPPEAYPLVLHTVLVLLGSSQGNQDHAITTLTMGIDVLEEGEAVHLPGFSDWALAEAPFQVTVASDHLNALSLDDPERGLYPLVVEAGDIAIWVCAPDPTDADQPDEWPYADLASDTSGLVIDADAPSDGSWLSDSTGVVALSDMGAEGSWVIRALSGYDEAVPLALSGLRPATTELGHGVDLVITGTGFDSTTVATIGGLPISAPFLVDDTQLTGRSPTGLPVGVHDLLVTDADGETATLAGAFTVTEAADADGQDSGTPGGETPACGCNAGGRTGGFAWLALTALGVARRRRSRD